MNQKAGVSRTELIVILSEYRGHSNDLNDMPQRELQALLKHYRVRHIRVLQSDPANEIQSAIEPSRGVKRERDDDSEVREGEKKQKREVIELD